MTEKIEQANKRELKRISKEKAEVVRGLTSRLFREVTVSYFISQRSDGKLLYIGQRRYSKLLYRSEEL